MAMGTFLIFEGPYEKEDWLILDHDVAKDQRLEALGGKNTLIHIEINANRRRMSSLEKRYGSHQLG